MTICRGLRPARAGVAATSSARTFALVGLRAGERPRHGQAVQGADQVQPQPPEGPRVGGAVAVLGPAGQVGALGGLPGAAALHRRGVDDPHVVTEHAGPPPELADQPRHRAGEPAQPLVVAGLLRQVREHRQQVLPGVTQPAGLTGVAQQRLHHRQGQQLRVADPRRDPHPRAGRDTLRMGLQQVVGGHIQCCGQDRERMARSSKRGGGYEIRTREGLPPTRFPSVRPRPLGESSATRVRDGARRTRIPPRRDRGPGRAMAYTGCDPSCGVIL